MPAGVVIESRATHTLRPWTGAVGTGRFQPRDVVRSSASPSARHRRGLDLDGGRVLVRLLKLVQRQREEGALRQCALGVAAGVVGTRFGGGHLCDGVGRRAQPQIGPGSTLQPGVEFSSGGSCAGV